MLNMNLPLRAFLRLVDFSHYRNDKKDRQKPMQQSLCSTIVLYDGDCPLCRQEMQRLQSLDQAGRLTLLDINSPAFNEQYWGVSVDDASQALHVLTAEKIWMVGMPAIRHVYTQVGLAWLMAPSGWPLISRLADLAYRLIAPNRFVISRWLGLGKINNECTEQICTVKGDNDKS